MYQMVFIDLRTLFPRKYKISLSFSIYALYTILLYYIILLFFKIIFIGENPE